MSSRAARSSSIALALLALLASASARAQAQKVYACPQPDGPVRYQDRPCAATPPVPSRTPASAAASARAATGEAADDPARAPVAGASASRAGAALGSVAGPRVVSPSFDAPSPPPRGTPDADVDLRAESRSDYLARNAQRCSAGDRRACAAVTCERSGGLGTKTCQAALGYRRGPGWDLRPATDVFDPARREDEYSLRCTQQSRRARVIAARDGGPARVYADANAATTVSLDSLDEFAARYCAAK